MKIVTVVRRVPDVEARVEVADDAVSVSGAAWGLDGMDEYGVEQALRMREGGLDAEVVALAVGPDATEEVLRTALAMGADRARLLRTDGAEAGDVLAEANLLADVLRDEAPDLVLTGGKHADTDSAALGPALAEHLGWPLADWTTRLELDGTTVRAVHDGDAGPETLTFALPAVVTTQQGLAEPRYPTLPNIMKAKRKPLDVADAPTPASGTRVTARAPEQRARARRLLDGPLEAQARELARVLREGAA
ncbi:MAG: electron transfer flavoprotein subunit beta/FixA family protein [Trueperaceae bacterium]|nr:electron transfer flavoprotein subunit beta/FixA family protein [Trueperaceae bacterium]